MQRARGSVSRREVRGWKWRGGGASPARVRSRAGALAPARALTCFRNSLLTSCLVTMPTALLSDGSTTATQPMHSFTRLSTTLDSLSSGTAVTHLCAGIMNVATDGILEGFRRARK